MSRTYILHLAGVFLNELAFSPRPAAKEQAVVCIYNEIPRRFTTAEEWPKSTNLKCWNCDMLFSGPPRFIPKYPSEESCTPEGNFCRANCAAKYVRHHYHPNEQPELLSLISMYESKLTGQPKRKIAPAPSKTEMRAYCGPGGLTQQEWLDKVAQQDTQFGMVGTGDGRY